MSDVLWSASVEHLVFLRRFLPITRRALGPVHAAQTVASAQWLIGVRGKAQIKRITNGRNNTDPQIMFAMRIYQSSPCKVLQ